MTNKTATIGPDGKPLPVTHRVCDCFITDGAVDKKALPKEIRVLFGPVRHAMFPADQYYVVADAEGNVMLFDDFQFETPGFLEYIPGGV